MTMMEISELRNEELLKFYDNIIQDATRLDDIQVRKVQIKHTAGLLRNRIRVLRFFLRILPRVDEDRQLKAAITLDSLEKEESSLELEIARIKIVKRIKIDLLFINFSLCLKCTQLSQYRANRSCFYGLKVRLPVGKIFLAARKRWSGIFLFTIKYGGNCK